MSAPQKLDITIYRGDDYVLSLKISKDGVPQDLTGQPIISQIRKTTALTSPLIAAFTVVRTNESAGEIELHLSGSDTQSLPGGDYKYDLQIHTSTRVYGTATILEDVSR